MMGKLARIATWLAFANCLVFLTTAKVFLKETFSDNKWQDRWVQSEWRDDMGKFVLTSGSTFNVDPKIEQGLQTSEDLKFYAISTKLSEPVSTVKEPLVVQFSIKNEDKKSSFCGGGYIKLLPASLDQKNFGGSSDYYIMFGPDICGHDVSRIHLIFNYNGENLLKTDDIKLEFKDKDELTHLYTLVLNPDGTYKVLFDNKERVSGTLASDWSFPQKTKGDPNDIKPSDWIDEKEIDDPDDTKPEGYDDIPKKIPDPNAEKPADWDDEDDGVWEAPQIKNPEFKGKWKPRQIPNPLYKGEWKQKQIENKDFKPEKYGKYEDILYVGFEEWIVNKGSIFDNIFVGNNEEEAKKFAEETFEKVAGKDHENEKEAKKKWEDKNKPKEEENAEEMETETFEEHEPEVKEEL